MICRIFPPEEGSVGNRLCICRNDVMLFESEIHVARLQRSQDVLDQNECLVWRTVFDEHLKLHSQIWQGSQMREHTY